MWRADNRLACSCANNLQICGVAMAVTAGFDLPGDHVDLSALVNHIMAAEISANVGWKMLEFSSLGFNTARYQVEADSRSKTSLYMLFCAPIFAGLPMQYSRINPCDRALHRTDIAAEDNKRGMR